MANHKSALKRVKQNEKRAERNRFYRTRLKNITKDVRQAVEANDVAKAQEAFLVANKELHKLVSKGVYKKGTISRRVSRLHQLVNKLSSGVAA